MAAIKNCIVCGKEFTCTSNRQLTCSSACRTQRTRELQQTIRADEFVQGPTKLVRKTQQAHCAEAFDLATEGTHTHTHTAPAAQTSESTNNDETKNRPGNRNLRRAARRSVKCPVTPKQYFPIAPTIHLRQPSFML